MTAGEAIKLLPTKWRHDASVIVLAFAVAWAGFSLYGRLEAAEAKSTAALDGQKEIVQMKQDIAQMKQQVADTNQNVNQLVAVMLGQNAVVTHPAPPVPPTPSSPKKK